MRLLVFFTVIMLCLSGCSQKCFMLFDYRCEKVDTKPTSETTQQQQMTVATQQPANAPVVDTVSQTPLIPSSPCGPEQICDFNIDIYTQWLAQKINTALIDKDYIEQNIIISPKCEQTGCLPPPFHNTFEGMLQDNLLFYGVGVREIEDQESLRLHYQAQVVPIMGEDNNNMSKLVLTTTIIKANAFIFSDTSIFTINKWDAWQYRISRPASIIPITQAPAPQSAQQETTREIEENTIEPQPISFKKG